MHAPQTVHDTYCKKKQHFSYLIDSEEQNNLILVNNMFCQQQTFLFILTGTLQVKLPIGRRCFKIFIKIHFLWFLSHINLIWHRALRMSVFVLKKRTKITGKCIYILRFHTKKIPTIIDVWTYFFSCIIYYNIII